MEKQKSNFLRVAFFSMSGLIIIISTIIFGIWRDSEIRKLSSKDLLDSAVIEVEAKPAPLVKVETTIETPKTTILPTPFSEEEIDIMAKILYREADCVESDAERSMVIWTILNRLDAKLYGDDTITEVCTRPYQFAYISDTQITERNRKLVSDVVQRWAREKAGEKNVGRTLPKECLFFVSASNPAAGEWHNSFYSLPNTTYGEKIIFGYEPLENPYDLT